LVASQAWQTAPLVPQLASDGGLQALPPQQPLGHEVASQVHAPATQRWPSPHGAPLPHWHEPAGEQLSALAGSHATQALAPVPHALSDRG